MGEVQEGLLVTTESPAAASTGPGAERGSGGACGAEDGSGSEQVLSPVRPPSPGLLGLQTLLPAGPLPGIPSTIHTTFPLAVSSRLTYKSLTLDLPLPPPSHTYLRIFKELSSQGLVGLACLPPPISSLTTSPSPLGSSHTGPLSSPSLGPSFTPLPPHQPPQGLYTDFPHLDRSSPESPRHTPSGLCSHVTQVRPSLTAMSQPTPHALRVPAPWPVSFCQCRTSHHLR